MTTDFKLKNIAPEDIEELLFKVEKSFGIEFVNYELINIKTFGELCDHITNKIELESSEDCTTQQAFYKLREAISSSLQIENKAITTNLSLEKVLPKQNRRLLVRKIETTLGFKLNILKASDNVTGIFTMILILSIVELFIDWRIGILGFIFSVCCLRISNRFGTELKVKTIGDVVKKMTRENYLKSRRKQNTVNRKEIEKILTEWFSDEFDLEKSELTREAEF
jgi:acyl carrier protein